MSGMLKNDQDYEQVSLLHYKDNVYEINKNEFKSTMGKSNNYSLKNVHNIKSNIDSNPSDMKLAQNWLAGWMYSFYFSWLSPIFKLGYRRTLGPLDFGDLSAEDKCSKLIKKLFIYDWSSMTTWRIIFSAFGKDTLLIGLLIFPYIGARLGQPLLLRAIVQEIHIKQNISFSTRDGIIYAFGLFLCLTIESLTYQQLFFRSTVVGIRIRNSLSSFIYRQLLSINTSTLHQAATSQVINLVANDAKRFEDFWIFGHFLWAAPLEAIITFGVLSWTIGVIPTCLGYINVPILLFMQLLFSTRFISYCEKRMVYTDERISAFRELLHGCHTLKMYNWEKPIEDRIRKIRENETQSMKSANHLRAVNRTIFFASPCLFSLTTFGGLWLMGYRLKPEDVFTFLTFYNQMRLPLLYFLPLAIERISSMLVASERIDAYMRLKTITPQKRQLHIASKDNDINKRDMIIILDASFSWDNNNNNVLLSLNLNIKPGEFIGIIGTVGAGKSSLLCAIVGEMMLTSGDIRVNGSISYAAQSPWIFADTLRANILFGQELNEERYTRVLHACCLDVDIKSFGDMRDLIIIGEKGINLSGGQRARVSLARALYVEADIYLLDDPLASVDKKVAKHIFDACIGPQGLLSRKTRLLVTHQVHFLASSNQCILLANGQIKVQGSFDYVSQKYEENCQTNNVTETDTHITDSQQITEKELDLSEAHSDTKSILRDESSINSRINWSLCGRLFTASRLGWFGLFLLIFFMLVSEILFNVTNYCLALWSDSSYIVQQRPFPFAYAYIVLTFVTVIITFARIDYFFYLMLRGSTHLHNCMVNGILYTSMHFFESNQSGYILNRASRDQQIVDELLPTSVFDASQPLLIIVSSLILVVLINPIVSILIVSATPIGWYLCRYYMQSSRQFKQIENITCTSVYTFFSSSLNGLTSIRAFKMKDHFLETFINRIDSHTSAYITMQGGFGWLGVRLDIIAASLVLFTALTAIIMPNEKNPSLVALSLMICLNMTIRLQRCIQQLAEFENHMVSTERIDEYAQLKPEEDKGGQKGLVDTPVDWPSHGRIEFRNYTLRHRSELEPALHNINFCAESTEKIGIMGRTGAGKSSLFQGLLRFVERSAVNGEIFIDGIDISRVTLSHLRSHLSVIPQTPVLFRGTLRYNLDPFEIYTDEECFTALENAQLKHRVHSHSDGLYMPVTEFGSNFSVGECQLICLARAVLKRSKILLVDEATANVDHQTESLIQTVIAEQFRDHTILTIAHRLNTVSNNNRILVMDQGRIISFEKPENLFK